MTTLTKNPVRVGSITRHNVEAVRIKEKHKNGFTLEIIFKGCGSDLLLSEEIEIFADPGVFDLCFPQGLVLNS